ncbi:acyl-CoA dehydrogenase [Streptomyces sp. e14]|uniref:hypothetical protein n=1 Tax=Streptomyces sp. e14 TaxID=645465 RepID=UPI0001D05B3E|nr:hypothetical protein [Streptomyces sp. e14]EFF94292.1 acyl-CoA dehydrogenase [Streptomyces sp. e14]
MSAGLTPEKLEELLGDPADPANPFGYAAAVAHDEANDAPEHLYEVLRETDFHLNYLPRQWGGAFESFDRSLTLVRAAARRDVRIMPGTMFSIIAATCLQLHGTPRAAGAGGAHPAGRRRGRLRPHRGGPRQRPARRTGAAGRGGTAARREVAGRQTVCGPRPSTSSPAPAPAGPAPSPPSCWI